MRYKLLVSVGVAAMLSLGAVQGFAAGNASGGGFTAEQREACFAKALGVANQLYVSQGKQALTLNQFRSDFKFGLGNLWVSQSDKQSCPNIVPNSSAGVSTSSFPLMKGGPTIGVSYFFKQGRYVPELHQPSK